MYNCTHGASNIFSLIHVLVLGKIFILYWSPCSDDSQLRMTLTLNILIYYFMSTKSYLNHHTAKAQIYEGCMDTIMSTIMIEQRFDNLVICLVELTDYQIKVKRYPVTERLMARDTLVAMKHCYSYHGKETLLIEMRRCTIKNNTIFFYKDSLSTINTAYFVTIYWKDFPLDISNVQFSLIMCI